MKRIAYIDRDGTLIAEPEDFQVDAFEKVRFVPGMLDGLRALQGAGFDLVMVSNQDGLGTDAFHAAQFEGPQRLLVQLLESQGVRFSEVLIDPSLPEEKSPNRKPGVGMVLHHLRDRSIDLANSIVVGDRETDIEFARNLGARGFRLTERFGWPDVVAAVLDCDRQATVMRETRETKIEVQLNLDRAAEPVVATGLGFFDHMLEQLGKHSGIGLMLRCAGDTHIDEHHTVEDVALALGDALRQALGDKRGVARYGDAEEPARASATPVQVLLPMDEARVAACLDLSGRPYFVFEGAFPRERVGDLPTELVTHFFRSLSDAARMTLHLQVRGDNAHHMVEGCFKAVARCLAQAKKRAGNAVPSTKGVL